MSLDDLDYIITSVLTSSANAYVIVSTMRNVPAEFVVSYALDLNSLISSSCRSESALKYGWFFMFYMVSCPKKNLL